jgi:hypothetical protein
MHQIMTFSSIPYLDVILGGSLAVARSPGHNAIAATSGTPALECGTAFVSGSNYVPESRLGLHSVEYGISLSNHTLPAVPAPVMHGWAASCPAECEGSGSNNLQISASSTNAAQAMLTLSSADCGTYSSAGLCGSLVMTSPFKSASNAAIEVVRKSVYATARIDCDQRYVDILSAFEKTGYVSHRDFWLLKEIVDTTALFDVRLDDLIDLSGSLKPNLYLAEPNAWCLTEAFLAVSKKSRRVILDYVSSLWRDISYSDELEIRDLRCVFSRCVKDYATVRTVFIIPHVRVEQDAPSTQRWVHGFMLWTGAPPPAAVEIVLPHTLTYARKPLGGHDVSNSRSAIGRNRERLLYWKTKQKNCTRNLSGCAPASSSSFIGRRQYLRLDHAARRRPLYHCGNGKVGN